LAIGQYRRSVDRHFQRTGKLWAMKGASAQRSRQRSGERRTRRRTASSPSTAGSRRACRRGDWTSWVRRLWPRNGPRRTQQRLTHWSAEIRATHIHIYANIFISFYQDFGKETKILTCIQNKMGPLKTHTQTQQWNASTCSH
jgi:hypothetical protein